MSKLIVIEYLGGLFFMFIALGFYARALYYDSKYRSKQYFGKKIKKALNGAFVFLFFAWILVFHVLYQLVINANPN